MKGNKRAQEGPTKSSKCMGPREPTLKRPWRTPVPDLRSPFYLSVMSDPSGSDTREDFVPSARTPMAEKLRTWSGPLGQRLHQAFSRQRHTPLPNPFPPRAEVFVHMQSVSDSCLP